MTLLIVSEDGLAVCLLLGLLSCAFLGDENRTRAGDRPNSGTGELLDASGPARGSKVSVCWRALRARFRELIWRMVACENGTRLGFTWWNVKIQCKGLDGGGSGVFFSPAGCRSSVHLKVETRMTATGNGAI